MTLVKKMTALGAFTLERDDLVAISQRIASCIPKSFCVETDRPVVVSVDGTFKSGKKIFADYGRAALLNVGADDFEFYRWGNYPRDNNDLIEVKTLGERILCRGVNDYDEYAYRVANDNGLDVSFINLAWGSHSFGDNLDPKASLMAHFARRMTGGVVFVHNANTEFMAPDIEIRIEADYGDKQVNGGRRICPDVLRILGQGVGIERAYKHDGWARYIEITCHNQMLDAAGGLSSSLKDVFGFRSRADMPHKILELPIKALDCAEDIMRFPLLKKYKSYLEAHAKDMAKQPQADAAQCFEMVIQAEPKI